jgi:hypothetical protein
MECDGVLEMVAPLSRRFQFSLRKIAISVAVFFAVALVAFYMVCAVAVYATHGSRPVVVKQR